jgi:hypothetical protein
MLYLSYQDGLEMLQWQASGASRVRSSPGLKGRPSNSWSSRHSRVAPALKCVLDVITDVEARFAVGPRRQSVAGA